MEFKKELHTAMRAAKTAGNYLRHNQKKNLCKLSKGNNKNFATAQDLESNRLIINAIESDFPGDHVLSEESADKADHEGRLWIIDPLDGTRNYANGLPYYSISIALFQDGELKMGVVYAPRYNSELFYAIKDHGAFLNDKPLKMARKNQELSASLVATGFNYFKGKELKPALNIFEEVLNRTADVVRFGSAALDLCHVAAGRIGAYYECGEKPWDIAGGMLILQEQGGIVTDLSGKLIDIFKKNNGKYSIDILSSKNRRLHNELVKIISEK